MLGVTHINAELACTAVQTALAQLVGPRGVIMHTDRGSVCCGWDHRNLIRHHGLIARMSNRGNCYANAMVRSFFHSLRIRSIHDVPLMHTNALRQALFETVEVASNRTHRHSALGYINPDAFEAQIMT